MWFELIYKTGRVHKFARTRNDAAFMLYMLRGQHAHIWHTEEGYACDWATK
jgi:hypothetical protein